MQHVLFNKVRWRNWLDANSQIDKIVIGQNLPIQSFKNHYRAGSNPVLTTVPDAAVRMTDVLHKMVVRTHTLRVELG